MAELAREDIEAVRRKVDGIPRPWPEWGGGWPDQVEAALIDAVLSIQARYGSSSATGVRGAVDRYLSSSDGEGDDLATLATHDWRQLQKLIGKQETSGNPKAKAIVVAAGRLLDAGVRRATDLDPDDTAHKRAYTGVPGLGPVTWTYFTMLLGNPSIKADTWIVCFVHGALGRKPSSDEAKRLLGEVATQQDVSATALDHAVWQYARKTGHRKLGCS